MSSKLNSFSNYDAIFVILNNDLKYFLVILLISNAFVHFIIVAKKIIMTKDLLKEKPTTYYVLVDSERKTYRNFTIKINAKNNTLKI